jgi:hypothetical protein
LIDMKNRQGFPYPSDRIFGYRGQWRLHAIRRPVH